VRVFPKIHRAALVAIACASLLLPVMSTPASAITYPAKVTKSGKATLSVKPVKNLNATSNRIRVKGKGFDQRTGIYVALCVTPRKGSGISPGPCGGGINMTASDPSSAWISSNPPPYGRDLAIPYSKGGRFSVTLTVNSQIGDIDCRRISCAIVTRADHTKSSIRTSDLFIPVTFK